MTINNMSFTRFIHNFKSVGTHSLEHGIAIILVVAGTGLIYIRTRKNQHYLKPCR